MKIAVITDQHAGIKNDASWMLDYQEKFYDNVFFPYLHKNNIKNVLNLGDIFDRRKFINFSTLYRFRKMFLDKLRDNNINMYIIPGNHDTFHKSSSEINSLNELLEGYKNIRIMLQPQELTFENETFAFIPWINPDNEKDVMNFVQDTKAPILCGHLELLGFDLLKGIKSEHGMDASLFKKFERVWSGHYHTQSKRGNVHYLGCPYEQTFADYNDKKGFHVFDTNTRDLEFIENPYTLHEKIFYDETKERYNLDRFPFSEYQGKIVKLFVKNRKDQDKFDKFVFKFNQIDTIDFTIYDDYSKFTDDSMDIDISGYKTISTKELIDDYIDKVEIEMSKDILKSYMKDIYLEALTISREGTI